MGKWDSSCLLTGEESKAHTRRTCKSCKMMYSRKYRLDPRVKLKEQARYFWESVRTKMWDAKAEVYKAVRRGDLPRVSTLKCLDCGAPATCYDHRDYDKPLEVQPVCGRHNILRGAGLNRLR